MSESDFTAPPAYLEPEQKAAMLARCHVACPPQQLVSNLDTRVELLRVGEFAVPVTVDDGDRGNAWVCSPLTTYWRYAEEEMLRYAPRVLAWPIKLVCAAYGRFLRQADIDRVAAINNWLVTTNIHGTGMEQHLDTLIAEARRRWPGHALWVRSLNTCHDQALLQALRQRGFIMIPSRQVYLYDDPTQAARKTAQKRDMKLMRETPLTRVGNAGIGENDYERIAELYALLYVGKYSVHNPQYTARFMRDWHRAGVLHFEGFRDEQGVLQSVAGMMHMHGVVTPPIVGYDTAKPVDDGLYRLAMALVFDYAQRHGAKVHLSSGAAHFKRLRGGVPAIEYSAVLASHMPARTRRALGFIAWCAARIGVPIMEKFKL